MYDIHLSKGMNDHESGSDRSYTDVANYEAILKKYDVTPEEWDSSYNYYCRHADQLYDIYEKLSERFRSDVIDFGGDVSLDEASLSGDTANVWNSERNFILMQQAPYNLHRFAIKTDSTFKAGDVLKLQFSSKFLFQDGTRGLVAVLVVTLGNDSVVSQTCRAAFDGRSTLSFSDTKRLGIKDVKGFFILMRSNRDQISSAFHLASVEDVRLILAHSKEVPETPITDKQKEKDDTLKTDSASRIERNDVFARPEDRPSRRIVAQ